MGVDAHDNGAEKGRAELGQLPLATRSRDDRDPVTTLKAELFKRMGGSLHVSPKG
jgi:hypothetical protein